MKTYDELLAENAAFASQVEVLRKAALNAISLMSGGEAKAQLRDAYDATPQQCLAEIKVEAGRAGFIEGVRQICDNEIGMLGHDAESCANHYAARVRLGFEPGTWLKDSNVNGGKRQGGEK